MRTREEIECDLTANNSALIIEILLDIRDQNRRIIDFLSK
jgi:hypothetical protein